MAEERAASKAILFRGRIEPGPSLPDRVTEYMLETILAENLEPGASLPSQQELAERFGVSRTVIREAVRSLVAKGVVEVRSGRRLRVAAVAPATVAESLALLLRGNAGFDLTKAHEVRVILETHVAALAAERAQPADLERLVQACNAMATAKDDIEASALHDVSFHRSLAESTHNELFTIMLDSIASVLLNVRRSTLRVQSGHQKALRAHRAILRGVQQRDPELARREMHRHLNQVAEMARLAEGLGGAAKASDG